MLIRLAHTDEKIGGVTKASLSLLTPLLDFKARPPGRLNKIETNEGGSYIL